MAKFKDLTGMMFGKLTVIEVSRKVQSGNRKRYYWNCKCVCGKTKEVRTDCLTSGDVKSCGCIKKEQDKINLTKFHRHKLSNTNLWHVYYGILHRCYNTKDTHYANYGGKGVVICEEWKESFDNFVEWAFSSGYEQGLQIDRIDNDGNYEPSNCRWVSLKENCRNRGSNILVEYNGKLVTLVEVSEILKRPYKEVYYQYRKYGIKRSSLKICQHRGNQSDCERLIGTVTRRN